MRQRVKARMRRVSLIACLILLSSCAATGRGSLCDDGPILVGQGDQLTDATARAILRHNLRGRALCGW